MRVKPAAKTSIPRSQAALVPKLSVKNFWLCAGLVSRATGLLCLLPILEKFHALPALLSRLTPAGNRQNNEDPAAMAQAVRLIIRICYSRPFRLSIFPKACLRQSLVLYHTLTHMGYPVQFHIGVRKEADEFNAHSWVTFNGGPVAERTDIGELKIVYSYPPNPNSDQVINGGSHGTEKIAAAAT